MQYISLPVSTVNVIQDGSLFSKDTVPGVHAIGNRVIFNNALQLVATGDLLGVVSVFVCYAGVCVAQVKLHNLRLTRVLVDVCLGAEHENYN